ncbi:hypothetical protein Mtc_1515 [Methanocella conradii HZ254]|uniref:Uncharacterized protein n=1 Tax=Methanocella conradii (strain DSM 24694 / JCM 17849 / CGMCC 1.5162 / HZ254) TaxID=1041930 RepID=H8I634_METCZ|nr:hypothetical protein Mtc_1515 [Methanocella conradii HZ254]
MLEIPSIAPSGSHNSLFSLLERFIEKHSGEYTSKEIYENFSKKTNLSEFNRIINELADSGKIAIDSEGKICYIWDPESVKRTIKNKRLAFRR